MGSASVMRDTVVFVGPGLVGEGLAQMARAFCDTVGGGGRGFCIGEGMWSDG